MILSFGGTLSVSLFTKETLTEPASCVTECINTDSAFAWWWEIVPVAPNDRDYFPPPMYLESGCLLNPCSSYHSANGFAEWPANQPCICYIEEISSLTDSALSSRKNAKKGIIPLDAVTCSLNGRRFLLLRSLIRHVDLKSCRFRKSESWKFKLSPGIGTC